MRCRAQELCEIQGGRPGLLVHNKPHGFCELKATLINRSVRGVACSDVGDLLH